MDREEPPRPRVAIQVFSTVHAYTDSQSLSDQPKAERRDSWAAAENIIPCSSGAAKGIQARKKSPSRGRGFPISGCGFGYRVMTHELVSFDHSYW